MKSNKSKPKLVIRHATIKDIDGIQELSQRVYQDIPPYTRNVLRGQINHFPEGQFVAIYENKIVGYCASILVDGKTALSPHTWREVTGNGYGSTHIANGDYLYGMEVFVDPEYRGLRIGERFYSLRKELCKERRLKGIVFGGRLPLLHKHLEEVGSVENYIDEVSHKKIKDPILAFQLRQGFEIIGVLEKYLPSDKESLGYAAHLIWRNPAVKPKKTSGRNEQPTRTPDSVRVAVVQYAQRSIQSFEEFEHIVTYFVDVVADYHSDFVLFPELFTLQLLSIENEEMPPEKAIAQLTAYTRSIRNLFQQLAIKYNVNIIAGSTVPSRTLPLFAFGTARYTSSPRFTRPRANPTGGICRAATA